MEESPRKRGNCEKNSGYNSTDGQLAGNIPGMDLIIFLVYQFTILQIRVILSIESDMYEVKKGLEVRVLHIHRKKPKLTAF
jgi:hypothetical protein